MVRRDNLRRLPDRFPLSCHWEITCRCNLRCVMCYTDCFNFTDKIREELATAEILRIMDELADAAVLNSASPEANLWQDLISSTSTNMPLRTDFLSHSSPTEH